MIQFFFIDYIKILKAIKQRCEEDLQIGFEEGADKWADKDAIEKSLSHIKKLTIRVGGTMLMPHSAPRIKFGSVMVYNVVSRIFTKVEFT